MAALVVAYGAVLTLSSGLIVNSSQTIYGYLSYHGSTVASTATYVPYTVVELPAAAGQTSVTLAATVTFPAASIGPTVDGGDLYFHQVDAARTASPIPVPIPRGSLTVVNQSTATSIAVIPASSLVTVSSFETSATSTSSSSELSFTQLPSTAGETTHASSTSTGVPSIQSSSDNGSGKYRVADLVGAAVGCLFGGLLIAGIVGFFCLRKRGLGKRRNLRNSDRELSPLHGHGEAVYLGGAKLWEKHLPQSESDGTIRNLASRTFDQIELHVENYYTDEKPAPLSVEVQLEIEDLDTKDLDSPVLQLIKQADNPTVLIKRCIAGLIVSRIDGTPTPSASFLPAEFVGVLHSSSTYDRPAYSEAAAKWRVLTSYLRSNPETDGHYLDQRDRTITRAAQQICQAFGPWARRHEDEARLQNLISIMRRASEFGVTLFAQPAVFEWQWFAGSKTESEHNTMQVVVLPGLYKTTDKDAQPLASPLHLLEPRKAALRARR